MTAERFRERAEKASRALMGLNVRTGAVHLMAEFESVDAQARAEQREADTKLCDQAGGNP